MDQGHVDTVVGSVNTAIGAGGLTLQVVTGYANLAVTLLNILAALGGLYLLYRRIKRDRRKPLP